MGRIKSFRQLIRETCWRIIWQFSLGLLMAYLIPLASVSIQINEDGKPLNNSGVLSIFFNVSSWIYICVLLIILISYHIGKLLKKLSYEMNLIYRLTKATMHSRVERLIGHIGTETRPKLLREAAVGNLPQWTQV